MAGSHGVQIEKLLSNEKSEMFKKKHKILSKAKGYKDLGYVFDYDNSLSYIDGVHYSPSSSKKIALELFKILN